MTEEQTEETVPEGKQIRATGHITGSEVEISVTRGPAVVTLKFDANEELDDHGMGSVDYIVAGLPEAAAQVMDALNAKIDEAASE